MKRLALLIIALFCASAFADDLPKIAVYVTGNMRDDEKKALGTRMMSTIVRSGRYRAVERSDEFLNQLASEHSKQRSGAIDDAQIKRLGKQFGIDFICIADITPAFGMFYVSARIIDVETAEIVFMGEASDNLRTLDGLAVALDKVWANMFGSQTVAAPEQKQENIVAAAALAPVSAQRLMKPKYEKTKMYPSDNLGAYGSYSIIGPNDVLTVLFAERNYYKVRTASGKEGFVMQKDVINSNAQFVDIRPGQSAVNTRQEAPVVNTANVTVTPRQETSTAPTEIQDDKPRILNNYAGIELGLGLGRLGTSVFASLPNSNLDDLDSDSSIVDGPIKINIDLIYAEMSAYFLGGYGGVESNVHILGKYPINAGFLKISPLLGYSYNEIPSAIVLKYGLGGFSSEHIGFEDNQFTLGGRVDVGLSKSAYISTEYLYSIGAGSDAQLFKISTGFDVGMGRKKRWFWRPELMYQYTRTAYNDGATISGGLPDVSMEDVKCEHSKHFVGVCFGLGYKWRVNKQSRSTDEARPAPSPIQTPETRPVPPAPPPPPPPPPGGSDTPSSDWGGDNWGTDSW